MTRRLPPLSLALLVLLHAVFVLASTGRVRTTDEYMAVFQSESLLLRGSTAVPQAVEVGHFYGKLDPRGLPRAPYAPGHALAAAPWTALGRFVLARAPGVPADAQDLVESFGACLSSAAFAAAAAALIFALWRRLGVPDGAALAAAAALALGTPLLGYAGWFFSEPLTSALLAGAALALFGGGGAAIAPSRAALAGLLLGAAVWVRPTQAIAAPVFALALLIRDGRGGLRAAAALGAAFALGPALYLVYNAAIFGRPLEMGYPDAVEGGRRLNDFSTPLVVGLSGFLLSPGKSVLLFAPPLLFALAGLRSLARRDRGLAALSVLAPLAYLLFYATYAQWEGGYCYGPRYLVPAIVLGCLPLGPALADAAPRGRKALLALALAGCLVQSVGLATSFLEDQRPGGYYDQAWRYRWGHAPLASQGALLLRYARDPAPAPLGKGLDRWFLFLPKGGVAPGACLALALAVAASGVLAALVLRQRLRGAGDGARGGTADAGSLGPTGAQA